MILTKQFLALAIFVLTISIAPATAMPDASARRAVLPFAVSSPGVRNPSVSAAGVGTPGVSTPDPTIIQGVNTAGTVRVNNLANLEALLNIGANTAEIVFSGLGLFYLSKIFRNDPPNSHKIMWLVIKGTTLIGIGVMTPGVINWLVASARDSSLCGGVF